MDSKDWTSIVVVMVVVAIAVSFVSSSFTGQTVKVQTNLTGPVVYTTSEIDSKLKNINAISCNADDVCEMNKARIGYIYINSSNNTYQIYTPYLSTLQLGNQNTKTRIYGPTALKSLEGTKRTYVCVDQTGALFRSPNGSCA